MAQFTGFTCDVCGNVVASDQRVKRTLRFERDGDTTGKFGGEVKNDLCPECAVAEMNGIEDIKPLRRRKKADEDDGGTETPPDPPQAVQQSQTGAPGTSEPRVPLPS